MSKEYEDPKCECFTNETTRTLQVHQVNNIVQSIGQMFTVATEAAGICPEGKVYVLEQCIIQLATIVAIAHTVIEPGTQESEWKTDRVLTNIEIRVRAKLRDYHQQYRDKKESRH